LKIADEKFEADILPFLLEFGMGVAIRFRLGDDVDRARAGKAVGTGFGVGADLGVVKALGSEQESE